MDYQTIVLTRAEGVATITLNRPEKLNAMTAQMSLELLDACKTIDVDPEVRVMVINGAGRVFCAGADINEFLAGVQGDQAALGRWGPAPSFVNNIPFILRNMVKPTIAAMHGAAVGIGLTVPLACDIRVVSEETKLGPIFAQMGLVPEFGSSYTLPRLVGIAKACELVLTSKILDAAEARDIGLVNQVVPAEQLATATAEMAARIASLPPIAIQLGKKLLYQGLDNDLASIVQLETLAIDYCFKSEDHAEAVRAFMEKRPPVFKGR